MIVPATVEDVQCHVACVVAAEVKLPLLSTCRQVAGACKADRQVAGDKVSGSCETLDQLKVCRSC